MLFSAPHFLFCRIAKECYICVKTCGYGVAGFGQHKRKGVKAGTCSSSRGETLFNSGHPLNTVAVEIRLL